TGPQTPLAHLVLERRDQLLADRVVDVIRVRHHEVERLDLVAHELLDPVEVLLELGIGLEVPHGYLTQPRTRPACSVSAYSTIRATLPSRQVYTQQYSLMYSAPLTVVADSFCCTAAVSPSTMTFQGSRFIVERSNILPDTPPV